MDSTLKRTWAEIDLDALAHNYKTLRDRIGANVKFLKGDFEALSRQMPTDMAPYRSAACCRSLVLIIWRSAASTKRLSFA